MDFLRRLAPLRDTDATRAVAVLPSRFASEGPLRAASAVPGRLPPLDEGEFAPVHEAVMRRAPVLARVEQRLHGEVELARVEPLHPHGAQPKLPERLLPEAHAIPVASARAADDRQSVGPQHMLSAAAQRLAAAPAVVPGFHANPLPSSRDRVNSPLSQAVVAQRAQTSRDDSSVVHVTIGRIDVVAGTPPAPAARRSPKVARAPTVALADYLRAGNGSRR